MSQTKPRVGFITHSSLLRVNGFARNAKLHGMIILRFYRQEELKKMRREVKVFEHETYRQALARTVAELGQPTRQKILDLLLIEGLKVGDICDRLDIEVIIVVQVICDNIVETAKYINSLAK